MHMLRQLALALAFWAGWCVPNAIAAPSPEQVAATLESALEGTDLLGAEYYVNLLEAPAAAAAAALGEEGLAVLEELLARGDRRVHHLFARLVIAQDSDHERALARLLRLPQDTGLASAWDGAGLLPPPWAGQLAERMLEAAQVAEGAALALEVGATRSSRVVASRRQQVTAIKVLAEVGDAAIAKDLANLRAQSDSPSVIDALDAAMTLIAAREALADPAERRRWSELGLRYWWIERRSHRFPIDELNDLNAARRLAREGRPFPVELLRLYAQRGDRLALVLAGFQREEQMVGDLLEVARTSPGQRRAAWDGLKLIGTPAARRALESMVAPQPAHEAEVLVELLTLHGDAQSQRVLEAVAQDRSYDERVRNRAREGVQLLGEYLRGERERLDLHAWDPYSER